MARVRSSSARNCDSAGLSVHLESASGQGRHGIPRPRPRRCGTGASGRRPVSGTPRRCSERPDSAARYDWSMTCPRPAAGGLAQKAIELDGDAVHVESLNAGARFRCGTGGGVLHAIPPCRLESGVRPQWPKIRANTAATARNRGRPAFRPPPPAPPPSIRPLNQLRNLERRHYRCTRTPDCRWPRRLPAWPGRARRSKLGRKVDDPVGLAAGGTMSAPGKAQIPRRTFPACHDSVRLQAKTAG